MRLQNNQTIDNAAQRELEKKGALEKSFVQDSFACTVS
jgi:hypothetical protein